MQTFKKVITIFLLAAMLCSLMPAGAIAEEYKESEEESASLTEEIPDSGEESASDPEEVPVEVDADPEEAEEPGTGSEESTGESENSRLAETLGEDSGEVEEEALAGTTRAEGDVAYVSNTDRYYASLDEAFSASAGNGTITLINDCTVSEPIIIEDYNVTITDDGTPHSIYFCNSNSESESGRGIIVRGGCTLRITSSVTDGITLVGHSNEDTPTYNYSYLIYATTSGGAGKVYLDGVTVTGCRTTSAGALGAYKYSEKTVASLCLTGCTITGNTSSGGSGGAAVFNSGNLYLQDGTEIYGNCSKSETSGAVYCKSGGTVTVSGNVNVSGNYKNCTKGSSGTVYADGDASDIYVESNTSLKYSANASGSIGVDYAGDSNGKFAVCSFTPSAKGNPPFFSNQDSLKCARYDAGNTAIYWADSCSFTPGSAKAGSGLSYNYSSAALTCNAESLSVSVLVDSGSFQVGSGTTPASFSGYAILDGSLVTFTNADFNDNISGKNLSALTVTSAWSDKTAQSFIQNLVFTPDAYGVAQEVRFGFDPSVEDGSSLFGDKVYRFVSTAGTRYAAYSAAVEAGEQLVCITNETINDVITAISGGVACWTGGALVSDQWYFPDGTRYSASAVSSKGYNGCFTAWGDNEPASSGTYMYAKEGKWYAAADSGNSCDYMLESSALCSKTVSNTVSNPDLKTRLNSYSLELGEGEIAVNYFFTFSQAFISDATGKGSYVEIKIGNEEAVQYYVSDIIKNKAEHNSDAYKLTVPVAPKYMNADMVIEFYWGDNTLLGYYGGEGKTSYNVRQYALTVIDKQNTGDAYNSGFSQALVDLVKVMLNYGSAAESQFNCIPEVPANTDYVDESAVNTGITGYFKHDNSEVSYTLSLFAESNTVMRITPSSSTFSATVDGAAADCTGGYIDIPVAMQDLGHIYTISFSGGFADTLQINVIKVIEAIVTSTDESITDDAKLTADRLYKMGLAADEYFGTYVPSASATQAVLNTAYAYLAKAEYTQYDQGKMAEANFGSSYINSRRQLDVSPEDATECSSIYMDCSSFVYNVYREVFGEKAVQDAFGLTEAEMNTHDMMYAESDNTRCTSKIRLNQLNYICANLSFEALYSMLQPGDLIVKYRESDSHGHVVLWTGDGYIHCTGSSYDYNNGKDKTEASGAVKYVPLSKFNESFYDGFDYLTVLRPLQELGGKEILSSGTARQQLGGLSVSKTATVSGSTLYTDDTMLHPGNSVNPGDTITFTITVSNPSLAGALNTSRTVDIEDTLPEGLTLDEGQSLSCSNMTIEAGKPKTLSYTATVTAEAGTVILASNGSCCSSEAGADAGKIVFSGIEISVEKNADSAIAAIISSASKYAVNKTSMDESADTVYSFIDDIYSSALGNSVLSGTAGSWISGLFGNDTSGEWYYVYFSDDSLKKALVSNFASGRKVLNHKYGGDGFTTDTRVRNVTSSNLMPGDLVCAYKDSAYYFYIYTGNNEMVSFIPGKTCLKVTANDILSGLLASDCFAVFRFAGRF